MKSNGQRHHERRSQRKLAKSLGAAIAARRERAGLTQDQVAQSLGVGNQAVSRLERGAVMPTLPRIFELADVFGCGVDELLLGASDRGADISRAIAERLGPLAPADRELVGAIVSSLAQRLAHPPDRRPRR